ncbi:MAG TPA: beta-ketoacyl-ACP synthase II [Dehalococcoidia bacterium]|nr:beta-ketoacyl-ACP synthase II [Dehalococcoidia bacterium]
MTVDPSKSSRQRVVITGMGAITPIGLTVDEYWSALIQGKSGIGPITFFDSEGYPTTIAAEVKGFEPKAYMDTKEARRMARFSQFAVAAATMALQDARIDLAVEDPEQIGVVLGNGNGGLPNIEEEMRTLLNRGGSRVNPFFMPMQLPNMAAAQISIRYGLKGYISTVITACAAGTQAIGEATEVIRRGKADVMVAGGTEATISEIGLAAFCALRALSTRNHEPARASRPFDKDRDGFVAAEGAGILVLESLDHALARGATILAEITGYGVSADAYHVVAPDAEGSGAARCMKLALADAHISPAQVDYINAHGTSTPLNDMTETLAIKRVFGEAAYSIPISSTKSMIGHLLGAAGGVEAVACVKTLLDGIIHPTINYETPDPQCDLDYVPNTARRLPVRTVLSNSFGFGGQNACLVFQAYQP